MITLALQLALIVALLVYLWQISRICRRVEDGLKRMIEREMKP